MCEIQDRYDSYTFPPAAYQMLNEMMGAVMNLKQNYPLRYPTEPTDLGKK